MSSGAPKGTSRGPVTLTTQPLELSSLDALGSKDLLLFVAEDERPLQGLSGLVDWRLCGALTRLIKRSLVAGKQGDSLLTVSGGRLPVERIFVVGVGRGLDPAAITKGLEIVAKAGGEDVAVAPFGSEPDLTERASHVAQAAHRLGLSRLTFLAEQIQQARKALVVVEAQHPWARLEDVL